MGVLPATDKEALLAGLLRVGDTLIAGASCSLAYYLWIGGVHLPSYYWAALVIGALLTLNAMSLAGVYRVDRLRRPLRRFGRTLGAWGLALAALALLSVVVKTSDLYSRAWFLLWLLLGAGGLFLLRLGVALQVARWRDTGEAQLRVVVVGTDARALRLAAQLGEAEGAYMMVVGHVGRPADGDFPGRLLGDIEALPALVASERIEEAVVALAPGDAAALRRLMQTLRRLPITVRYALDLPELDLPARGVSEVAGLPMLDVWRRPMTPWELFLKATEDRVLAALFLVVAAPLMLLIALAIKLDSRGPVLFRQQRAGFGNGCFEMLKFRTMRHEPADAASVPQAQRNDPRITRLGAWLRRSSLDELPQLVNVLRGEMSLVGPRPHALAHDRFYAELIGDYLARQRVKPGMTGWAQVNGLRGETDTPDKMRRRVQFDLYYIDHWSVFFDLKILFLTLLVGFVNRNAY